MISASDIHGSDDRARQYLTGWQRERAALANLRRRLAAEQTATRERLTQEITQSLLTLADNFRAMTAHTPTAFVDHPWTQGVHHIARQLEQLLAAYGVTPIDTAVGTVFNPALHEAVSRTTVPGHSAGTVVEVLQPGYRLGEHILRPARVKVAM